MNFTVLFGGCHIASDRSRPTFAAWENVLVVGAAYAFSAAGAMLAALLGNRVREYPIVVAFIAAALAFGYAVPITLTTSVATLLRPVRDPGNTRNDRS